MTRPERKIGTAFACRNFRASAGERKRIAAISKYSRLKRYAFAMKNTPILTTGTNHKSSAQKLTSSTTPKNLIEIAAARGIESAVPARSAGNFVRSTSSATSSTNTAAMSEVTGAIMKIAANSVIKPSAIAAAISSG
jgi:hypothetical protein